MASNFLDILSQLHDRHVEFVIVGGVAASLHGGSRVTFDLDIVPRLDPASWHAAIDRAPDGSPEVDLLVSESDRFEALRERAVKVTIDQRTFFVASIDDLIAMKQLAGRPQDLLD